MSEEWLEKLRVGFAKGGDALLSHKGTIGETSVVPKCIDVLILSPQVTYYRTGTSLEPVFLVGMFRTEGFQANLKKEAKQSTRAYIGITRQKKLQIVCPPIELQKRYSNFVSRLEETRNSQIVHQDELDSLFASLQQRAFNGTL